MAFFQQACREAFGGALLVLCPEPECSIARGLAYAGRVDERLKVFRQEVGSIAHGEKLSMAVNASAHELYEPVAHALFEMAQESTVEAVGLWRRAAWRASTNWTGTFSGGLLRRLKAMHWAKGWKASCMRGWMS